VAVSGGRRKKVGGLGGWKPTCSVLDLLYEVSMGLGIELQDEWGGKIDAVYDPKNYLGKLLPRNDDDTRPMLASIDPYGDTIFNGIQMRWFLSEWSEISAEAQTPEERELVSKIEAMAHHVRDEVHLYLKFIGD
jgi:hypothetical protein